MIIVLYQNIEMLIVLSVITQFFSYYEGRPSKLNQLIMGVFFGIVGLFIMAFPYHVINGVAFDSRSILVSLVSFLYGGIPSIIMSSMMLIFRIYLGGSGLVTGLLIIVFSMSCGLFWKRIKIFKGYRKSWIDIYLLGLLVHLTVIVSMFTLPVSIIGSTMINIGFPIMIFFPVITVIVGKVLSYHINRNENLKNIQRTERKFRKIFQEAPIGVGYATMKGEFIEVNRDYAKILGYSEEELVQKSIIDNTYFADLEKDAENMKKIVNGDIECFSMDKRYVKKDQSIIWVNLSVSKVQFSNDEPEYLMGIILDITERKNSEALLEHLAFHDQITDLFNRRYYEEFIEKHVTNFDSQVSIALISINGLRLINDAYGFKTGDLVLRKVADILTSYCVESSLIARLNNDEFIVIYGNLAEESMNEKVSSLYGLILNETVEDINISVSIGCASQETTNNNYFELYKLAENRMLTDKLVVKDSTINRTIDIIMNSLYEKNERELLHSKRVSLICGKLAKVMGMNKMDIEKIKIAGLMHDIGKIGVPDEILNKEEKLTEDEWERIKKHAEAGFRILDSGREFSQIADCVLSHHERWDGKGYPRGLQKEEIPLFSRIIAIADSYDAMTSKRAYRDALELELVVDELNQNAGKQFDPVIIQEFMNNLNEFKLI